MQVNKNKMIIAKMLTPLALPHILLYFLSPKRQLVRSDLGEGGEISLLIYRLVWDKPYRSLFYQRVGYVNLLFSWLLFPRPTTTSINNRYVMPLGEHCHLEHAHNIHVNARSIGRDFCCLHNVTIVRREVRFPLLGIMCLSLPVLASLAASPLEIMSSLATTAW